MQSFLVAKDKGVDDTVALLGATVGLGSLRFSVILIEDVVELVGGGMVTVALVTTAAVLVVLAGICETEDDTG